MEFSAVICTRDRYHHLAKAITSLMQQQGVDGISEIIVVDNSADAREAATFAQTYRDSGALTFLHSPVPGLSNARNLGASTASGRVVAYLDDDAVASPSWAASLLEAFEHYGAEAGIAGGPVRPIWEAPPPFNLTQTFKDLFSIVDRGNARRVMNDDEWLAGCNIAFDRKALLDTGGFDLGLGRIANAAVLLSNEETLACERIKRLGKTMIYVPDAAVDHLIPADRVTVDWIVRRVAWQAVSDAISNPEKTIRHTHYLASNDQFAKRAKRAFAGFRFWSRHPSPLEDRDFQLIYDTINRFLCTGL